MHSFFAGIEATALSTWIRESTSVWAFPSILTLHTVGMGFVAGLNAAVDLRVLGVAPAVPLGELRRFFPVMWLAFWINAISGVLLLIAYPTKALTNPLFYVKLAFIALAVVVLRWMRQPVANADTGSRARRLAIWSLIAWTGTITAGRLLAYTYKYLTASWLK